MNAIDALTADLTASLGAASVLTDLAARRGISLSELAMAGEHPLGATVEATRARLTRLLEAGVNCFIDLTQPAETPDYQAVLPLTVDYLRRPIPDHGVPAERVQMREILDHVHSAVSAGKIVYLHCRAGIGRRSSPRSPRTRTRLVKRSGPAMRSRSRGSSTRSLGTGPDRSTWRCTCPGPRKTLGSASSACWRAAAGMAASTYTPSAVFSRPKHHGQATATTGRATSRMNPRNNASISMSHAADLSIVPVPCVSLAPESYQFRRCSIAPPPPGCPGYAG